MAEQVTQRNKLDVVMELTHLHLQHTAEIDSVDDIQEIFTKYYALVTYCEEKEKEPYKLQELLNDELLFKVGMLTEHNPSY